MMLLVLLLAVISPLLAAASDPFSAAPQDAWPMARGCPAGTGRSSGSLRLPLAESWRHECDGTAFGAVPVIAAGTVYLGDLDGTFHAIDLDTGDERWAFQVKDAGFPSAAAVRNDHVVVGDDLGIVRAFDTTTGSLRWTYETDGEISGGPTIIDHDGGPRVLVGSQDASLACLQLATGERIWHHSIADQIRCSPTVARTDAGDRVFLAGCDGKLHVIDAATGNERAAVPIDGPTGTTPAVVGHRVFFGTEGGVFYAIDFVAADTAWHVAAVAAGQSYRSSAAAVAGLAIVGFRGKAIEAFALDDGTRVWRKPMRGRVETSPVAIVAEGPDGAPARDVVIAADASGTIVVLDAVTGDTAWDVTAGGRFDAGPAVASGRVVIASDDGTVWCFRSGD